MFCTNCGKESRDGVEFCVFCGTNLLKQKNNNVDITEEISQNTIKENEQTPVLEHQINNYNHQQDFQTTKNSLNKSDKDLNILKILSAISVLVFFLPIEEDWTWFFYNFSCNELAVISVPFFVSALTLLIVSIFNLTSKKGAFKTAIGLGCLNFLLSLCLVLPLPFNTQTLCLGSFVLLFVNAAIPVYGFIILVKSRAKKNTEYLNKEFFKKTVLHRTTLKVIALIGMITFFFPAVLSSCTIGDTTTIKKETGFSIINNSHGFGNAYAVVIFLLFLFILVSLFVKKRALVLTSFVLGLSNVLLLLFSKIVFADYIVKYLFGSYIMFFAALAVSIGGHIYLKESSNYIINRNGEIINKASSKGKARIINIIAYVIFVIVATVYFMSPVQSDSSKHTGNISDSNDTKTKEEASTPSQSEQSVSYDAFTFNESVFNAQYTLITWVEDIGNEWDATPYGNVFDVIQSAIKNYPDVYSEVIAQHDSIESTYNSSLSNLPNASYANIHAAVVKLYDDYIALYSAINCSNLTLMESSDMDHATWSANLSDLLTLVGEDYETLNSLRDVPLN